MARISKKLQDIQSTWEARILRAKKVRENWKSLFNVETAYDYFEGRQKDDSYAASDWITINNIYAHVKSQLPALYSADPYFYVKLKKSYTPDKQQIVAMEKSAKIRQGMLNYIKGKVDLKTKMRLCIFDAFFRYGVAKVHYSSDEKENPDFGKPMLSDDGKTPLIGDDKQPLMEPEHIPVNGRYNVTRIHPDDFIFDEDAGPLESDWKWCAQRIRMTLDDAEKNKNYNKKALKRLEGKAADKDEAEKKREERKKGNDIAGKSDRIGKRKESGDKEPEIISFWEIYLIDKGTYLTIAEGGEAPVMDEAPIPVGIEKHPFSVLRFTLRDDSPYPVPPLSQGIEPAKEYNRARSDIQKHRKRFNRKYVANRQAFGDDTGEVSKLESGDDGTIIWANMMAEGAISPVQEAQLDPMRYNELAYLKNEMIQLLGGSSEEARGIASAGTATQAGILDKRLEMREGDAMSMVVDFVKNIAKKLDQLIQANITRDEAIHITGPQGEYWELVKTGDYEKIDGEFEYSVNVGATIPQLPHVERASWLAFLQIAFANPAILLSKRLFRKVAEMHHIEDDAMIDEVYDIAMQMAKGQLQTGKQAGSTAGIGEDRPISSTGGAANGALSLVQGSNTIEG